MTLSFLLTSLVACGETGDTTGVTGTETTGAETTTTTSGTETTASEATTTTTEEPTVGTASETGTTTTSDTSTGETTGETTAVDTTGSTTASETTVATTADTTGETTADTTGETTADTTGETTGGETSPLVIAIVDAYLWADCMPVVEPDPVQGSWYVEFDNTDNPNDTSAIVTAASLSLADADPPVLEPISVQPMLSPPIPAGEYVSVEMVKHVGAMHSACEHCDEFYKLVLEYDEGGVSHHVVEDVTIACNF